MRTDAHNPDRSARQHRILLGALVLLALGGARPAVCQPPAPQQPASTKPTEARTAPGPPGAPVRLDGEILFYIRQGVGALSPEERAAAVEQRLIHMAEDPFYSVDQIDVQERNGTAEVFYRGSLVGLLSKEDAVQFGTGTPVEEATFLVHRITSAIDAYRERRQPTAVRRALVLAIVATLVLLALLSVVRRTYRRLVARVRASAEAARGETVVTAMVRSLDKTAALQISGLRVVRFGLTTVLVVIYLLLLFNLFPLTRGFAVTVAQYFLDPVYVIAEGIWSNIGNFIFIIVITVLARYLLKGLRLLLSEAAAGAITLPGIQPDWAMLFYKALRIAVVAIAAVVIYPYIPGSSTEAFKGIGIFAGALFTLGASGMAGSLLGGLALTFTGTFRIGDRVQIGDVVGDVLETTLMITKIRTLKNEIVTIPNSAIMSGHVIDYSARARTEGLLLTTEVTIGYNAPWRKVHELLIDAARRTPKILAQPAPFVLQKSLNDYHVSYVLWAYTADANVMQFTYGELHQNIQDAFNEGGIEILSPAYGYLRDGNETTIPAAYWPEGYRPEPFKVRVDGPPAKRSGPAE